MSQSRFEVVFSLNDRRLLGVHIIGESAAELVHVGTRSRVIEFRATVVGRGAPEAGESAARMLAEPIVATTATGTCVVPG